MKGMRRLSSRLTMDRSRSKTDFIRDLQRRNNDLQKQVDVLVNRNQSLGWIYVGDAGAPGFQNSWVNYDDGAGGNHNVHFGKDAAGNVHIRGICRSGTMAATIFTLPVGFRPPPTRGFSLGYLRFAVESAGAFGAIRIKDTGEIVAEVGSNSWVDLAGIVFLPG